MVDLRRLKTLIYHLTKSYAILDVTKHHSQSTVEIKPSMKYVGPGFIIFVPELRINEVRVQMTHKQTENNYLKTRYQSNNLFI